jgi:hypothetical protein
VLRTLRLLAVAVPPVAGLGLLWFLVAAEAMGRGFFSAPAAPTISEAAATGEAARVVELVRQGRDPNGLSRVQAGLLDSAPRDLTPIAAAILGAQPEMVGLLRQQGARVIDARRVACLAHARGVPEALDYLGIARSERVADEVVGVGDAIRLCQ